MIRRWKFWRWNRGRHKYGRWQPLAAEMVWDSGRTGIIDRIYELARWNRVGRHTRPAPPRMARPCPP